MTKREHGDDIPWWEVRGNPLARKIKPSYCHGNNWNIESHALIGQSNKDSVHGKISGVYHFNRSFVLAKIQRFLINPLKNALTRDQILQLVNEAFDFDLRKYKEEWYQANKN